tara:strand:+ start:213 stop:923 length:711 start_codon:yes stop_codon:yes gene_type:complete
MKSYIQNNNIPVEKPTICQKFIVVFSMIFYITTVFSLIALICYHLYITIRGCSGVSNNEIRMTCNATSVDPNVMNKTMEYTYIGETPSQIWMYCIFSCFFVNMSFFRLINNIIEHGDDDKNYHSKSQIIWTINLMSIVYISFAAWGWDQLYNSGTCLEYNYGKFDKNTWGWELMTSSYVSFYVQIIMCAIIFCFNICMWFTCNYQISKVDSINPDLKLRQVITGEGEVIKNIDNKQ